MGPLFPRQSEYFRQSDAFINIADGSVRSGKSVAQNWRWLDHIAHMPRNGLYLMTGTTQDTVVRNVLAPMQEVFGPARVQWNLGTDAHATIMGRRCPIIGANNVRSEYTIRGMTLHGWYADEVTLHPESVFDMARTRLSAPGAKAFVSCNPDSPYHWLMRNHMSDEALATGIVKRFRFKLDDNPSLNAEYVDMLRRSFTGLFRRRMIDGEWVLAEGVIYDMFDPAVHVKSEPGPFPRFIVSCDYGTANPCVFGLWVPIGYRWHMFGEYVWDSRTAGKQKTDEEYVEAMTAWLTKQAARLNTGQIIPACVFVDPSAASFIEALRRGGYTVRAARNDVLPGIRAMSTALSEGRMTFDPSCTWTLDEFGSYIWDAVASKRGEDKPLKTNDHSMDQCRYMIVSNTGSFANVSKPAGW